MINILRLFFSYLRAAIRSRGPIRCRGQTLVEYALIIAIISIVIVGVIVNLGNEVKSIYTGINSQVAEAASSH
jgi:Flp pilus assembly pilin Flp